MIRVSINGQYNAKIFEQAHGSDSKRCDQGYVLRNVTGSNPIVLLTLDQLTFSSSLLVLTSGYWPSEIDKGKKFCHLLI